MTTTEKWRRVFEGLANVDGGCSVCVREAFESVIAEFPETQAVAAEVWAAVPHLASENGPTKWGVTNAT